MEAHVKGDKWSRSEGADVEENRQALRAMRVIVWMFIAIFFDLLCLWAGLFIAWKIYGG